MTELHFQLARIWEVLLGVATVGIHDNFFALGGHSLLAVRLIGEIEREFGVHLPLAVLFEKPTVDQLALAMCDDPANLNATPMVRLNAGGTAAPLFFLHGSMNGGGFYTLGLARHLGPDRPLNVLRPHGTDGGVVPPTIEAIAAECVELVAAIQPHGPYLLGGFCSGGLVAFEMARQFEGRGERVDNVVLLDVPNSGSWARLAAEAIGRTPLPQPLRSAAIAAIASAAHHLRRFAASPSKLEFVRVRRTKIGTFFARPVARASAQGVNLETVWRTLSERYVPHRYAGRLTILVSGEAHAAGTIAPDGWSSLCERADVRIIRGNHLTCVTDFIDETAQAIAAALG